MNALNTNRINVNSPYKVWAEGLVLHFETENGIRYAVDFDSEDNQLYTAYWLNLTNESHKSSPSDRQIPKTLICIVEEFFRQNPDILLYMCSTDNNQQAQRARLFLRWFNGYEQQQKYVLRAADVPGIAPDGKPTREYVAIIVPRTHPQMKAIIELFDEEVAMFQANKPQDI
jgi:hypothetical protein